MTAIIVPGDSLPIKNNTSVSESTTAAADAAGAGAGAGAATKIGPGIYKMPRSQHLIPSTSGILHHQYQSNKNNAELVYIESDTKRYIPRNNDFVVGTVVGSVGDFYKVQLQQFSSPVLLPFMAFPSATKKNRPNLNIGQCVYARVINDDNDSTFETELSCTDAMNSRESGGFGVLGESGFVFDLKLAFARELLYNAKSNVLSTLATRVQFEIAVGINGRVWIKCGEGVIEEKKRNKNEETDGDVKMRSADGGDDDNDSVEGLRSRNLKNLRNTLAAVEFLKKCEKVEPEQVSNELKKAFKGI
ncbi:exosome non-catalytic core subunit rrp40 [Lodderomyces elongisporus]|uniref:exosome non-catalytic core subunit rrp40 n=1 Tax=Lodderomyces elongisporus TaxID=36914 RepID=UPI0029244FB0|nr:exosome non-catalytic core subunit rrp40 [Lodderomyces elongisporus]WLF77646.1 exosome non-catalytic core subunit rrp40 [Lodderomyces elongisporus]